MKNTIRYLVCFITTYSAVFLVNYFFFKEINYGSPFTVALFSTMGLYIGLRIDKKKLEKKRHTYHDK